MTRTLVLILATLAGCAVAHEAPAGLPVVTFCSLCTPVLSADFGDYCAIPGDWSECDECVPDAGACIPVYDPPTRGPLSGECFGGCQ